MMTRTELHLGEPGCFESLRQCGALEAVMAFEALAVEGSVAVLEIGDAEVTAAIEQLRERRQRRIEGGYVVQRHGRDDEIETVVGNFGGSQVDVPDPGVGDGAG